MPYLSEHKCYKFQSTLPRRERPVPRPTFNSPNYFNPRSREGSDFIQRLNLQIPLRFQSTLPRRERHARPDNGNSPQEISIHAPAKGATLIPFFLLDHTPISIHAPAKGATHTPIRYSNPQTFQSTLPRRERHLILFCPALFR